MGDTRKHARQRENTIMMYRALTLSTAGIMGMFLKGFGRCLSIFFYHDYVSKTRWGVK